MLALDLHALEGESEPDPGAIPAPATPLLIEMGEPARSAPADEPAHPGASPADTAFMLVRRHEELAAIAEAVARAGKVALDTETTGLDPLRNRLRLVQLGLADGRAFLIDVFETGGLGPVAEALGDTTVVGHHLQFDLAFLRRLAGVEPRARCTEIASRLLDGGLHPHVKGHHSLQRVLDRELGVALDKTEQTSDWSGPLRPEQLAWPATTSPARSTAASGRCA